MLDQFLTIEQAQSILPLSKAWYAKERWKKTGPEYIKIGSRVFYQRDSLVAFAERHAIKTIMSPVCNQEATA